MKMQRVFGISLKHCQSMTDNAMITIRGARQHNLKNIHVKLPKNQLIIFTGVSGSGKSSLAFDTIYAEGQRRYVESLSSYARQFLGIMDKPDVDAIDGLSPAISIDQKSASHNPRSTVGTVTEIYDYMRLLFARIGHPHCPNCGREISRQSKETIVSSLIHLLMMEVKKIGKKPVRCLILSPVVRDRKGEFSGLFSNLKSKGYTHVRVDGQIFDVHEDILLIKTNKHTIEAVVDRLTFDRDTLTVLSRGKSDPRYHTFKPVLDTLSTSCEQALALSNGLVIAGIVHDADFTFSEKPKDIQDHIFSERFSCPVCNISIPEIEPRSFSFNSPHGACGKCSGIGKIRMVNPDRILAPELTLSEGGIIPFAKIFTHDTWYARIMKKVLDDQEIDIRSAIKNLSHDQLAVILHGTGEKVYEVIGTNRFGEQTRIQETFSGVIAELTRRYSQTESSWVRNEIEKFMKEEVCPDCSGKRLKKESLSITIAGKTIVDVTSMNIVDARTWFEKIYTDVVSERERTIAKPIVLELRQRLTFLTDVGLEYLTLDRSATTLSGGESQRIRLASQIGSGLSGVLYVLDEPSIGLHPRDNDRLITTLKKLKALGNTVIVVEHDRDMMYASDLIVDFGPGAGNHGGEILACEPVSTLINNPKSTTARYLSGEKKIRLSKKDLPGQKEYVELTHVSTHNLKDIHIKIPLGVFVCVTGVSGSGKSSLVVETLYPALHAHTFGQSAYPQGEYASLIGAEKIDKAILIDQSPIGRTPRSNPATYTGLFTHIRDLFAQIPEAKIRGFKPGRFSFNVKGGRCEACEGEGQKKIEMQFLSDIYVTCEVCGGSRYSQDTLEIYYKGKSIAEVLNMTVDDAYVLFRHQPAIEEKLQILSEIGLGYIHLGQPATTLSGGEAQRVKLATELMRRATGKTVYILDEPSTGLHFSDIEKLLHILYRLTESGNTVVVIEHNQDIILNAQWIIDLGPDGGDNGGYIVAQGSADAIRENPQSYTGKYLHK